MTPYGSDRVRSSAGKVIVHSRLPKGWTPRTPKTNTHAEFPGTAVLWDDEYYEVLSADPLPAGGVRYVLDKWRDDHAIRVFAAYNAESEAQLLADHEKAMRQRRQSAAASWSGLLLGHLPGPVQLHLANELGVFPARLTIVSTIPGVVLLGVCVWLDVTAMMESRPSPIPVWLTALAVFLTLDGAVRFLIAMSQNRGTGSLPGLLGYTLFWLVMRKRMNLVAPHEPARGYRIFTLPPSEEVVREDSIAMRSWMLSLLTPAEQALLAERYGYDYRKHSRDLAWAILVVGSVGVLTSLSKLQQFSGLVSLIVAALIVLEQALRLAAFRRGPAGSVFGVLVRPFVRDLLRPESPRATGEEGEAAEGSDEL